MLRIRFIFLMSFFVIAVAHAQDEDVKDCFAAGTAQDFQLAATPLAMLTDQLVHQQIELGAEPMTIYALTRQMILLERMQRRLLARSFVCEIEHDGVARDAAVLMRTYEAYANGNAEIGVSKLATADAQALIAKIIPSAEALVASIKDIPKPP